MKKKKKTKNYLNIITICNITGMATLDIALESNFHFIFNFHSHYLYYILLIMYDILCIVYIVFYLCCI